MSRTAVVALGGNALSRESESGTYAEQAANAARMARAVGRLLATGCRVILVHGNGPQVGNLLIQHEAGERDVPAQPLFLLDSMTQGQIGSMLVMALYGELGAACPPVASVITHVVVDPADAAFAHPTKPVGPFFTPEQGRRLGAQRGWTMTEDAGRGWRRIVPSPEPREIVEIEVIRRLAEAGSLVIAGGGGGVPVVRRLGRMGAHTELEGVDAVIDKDRTAALLASSIGADVLILITGVPHVMLDFGTPTQRPVHEITVAEAERHLADGQFPPGSMGPKIEAAIGFLRRGGFTSVISTAELAADALAERPMVEVAGRDGPRLGAAATDAGDLTVGRNGRPGTRIVAR